MDDLIHKKIILCLTDCDPKSANEICNEIDESLATIEGQLTELVSENICEKINQDDVDQYILRKDVEAFAQLVKVFLSDKEKHEDEIKQFITSDYYHNRVDDELIDYVLRRFHLETAYKTSEDKHQIGRILLASPSALFFALQGDTAAFDESWAHWNGLNSPGMDFESLIEMLCSSFGDSLSEALITDTRFATYISLYDKLQIRLVKIRTQVSLTTLDEKYVEIIGNRIFGYRKVDGDSAQNWRAGQLISYVNPIDSSDDGLAFLNLGEFQAALDSFNKALNQVQDSNQKSIVLNNKGLVFLRLRQYQKAIECFKEGIMFDSEGKIPLLRGNKQVAEEYLTIATDADNLTEPTQVRFVQKLPVPFEETRFYEFKEIAGGNAIRSISDTSDIYAVAFLNHKKGGRIFWGIKNKDRITIGVPLNEQQRDELRVKVSEKLGAIQPSIVGHWQLELHPVYDLQGETIEDLWIIELVVPPPQRREVFYTGKGELHVKTEGGKKKLLGPAVTEFIRGHFRNHTEMD